VRNSPASFSSSWADDAAQALLSPNTMSLPMSLTDARSGPSGWRATISELVIPALKKFEPELLLISAGFDGLSSDPLGKKMGLSPEDYTWATRQFVKASQEMQSCNGESRVICGLFVRVIYNLCVRVIYKLNVQGSIT
jgi:hypothetical protein